MAEMLDDMKTQSMGASNTASPSSSSPQTSTQEASLNEAPAGGMYPTHPHPRGYVAYRADSTPALNGRLDLQPCWQAAPWSEDFLDIQGPEKVPGGVN